MSPLALPSRFTRACWLGALIAVVGFVPHGLTQILHSGDFESGDVSAFGLQGAFADSLTVVSQPVRSGQWAGKSFLRSSDPDVSSGTRAEFVDKTSSPLHQVRWYGLSIYAGDDFICPQQTDGVVLQFHQQASTGSPVLAFRLLNNKWRITSNTDLSGPRRTFTTLPLVSGVWTDWVIRVKWSEEETGELTIWQNDRLVFHETQLRTTYPTEQTGPSVKFGQYHSVNEVPENTLYFDSYRMAGPVSSYQDVAPSQQQPDQLPNFESARVVNLSTRAFVGTGDQTLVSGFVVAGAGTRRVLLRAVGPTLGDYGVADYVANPQLKLFSDAVELALNDDWNDGDNAAAVASTATAVGAFPLPTGSKDSALLIDLPAGVYTAQVSNLSHATGTALLEVYVLD